MEIRARCWQNSHHEYWVNDKFKEFTGPLFQFNSDCHIRQRAVYLIKEVG